MASIMGKEASIIRDTKSKTESLRTALVMANTRITIITTPSSEMEVAIKTIWVIAVIILLVEAITTEVAITIIRINITLTQAEELTTKASMISLEPAEAIITTTNKGITNSSPSNSLGVAPE